MRSICVFCGSSEGSDARFAKLAEDTGRAIARKGLRLVYGGAESGLMGRLARAALEEGGEVLGVIPEFLIPLEGLQEGVEPRITATLASRKAIMVEEADGFLVLPGGAGTLEEIFDMIMLRQLGRHEKPAAFLDAEFWGPLETLLLKVVDAGFAQDNVIRTISFHAEPDAAINRLESEWTA
ncbi:TIGR00730 family Rossman fold protein [Oceanicaulis sp. LC35]|uniref:LOG family protein n=1 Tax=Oceanicaulis sp. LC35 TaxID=3349635 RepID=UPI003F82B2BF